MKKLSDTHIQLWDDCEPPVLIDFKVGDTVQDDLTGKKAKIVRFTFGQNTIGVWLNNDLHGGGRHPWEISKL